MDVMNPSLGIVSSTTGSRAESEDLRHAMTATATGIIAEEEEHDLRESVEPYGLSVSSLFRQVCWTDAAGNELRLAEARSTEPLLLPQLQQVLGAQAEELRVLFTSISSTFSSLFSRMEGVERSNMAILAELAAVRDEVLRLRQANIQLYEANAAFTVELGGLWEYVQPGDCDMPASGVSPFSTSSPTLHHSPFAVQMEPESTRTERRSAGNTEPCSDGNLLVGIAGNTEHSSGRTERRSAAITEPSSDGNLVAGITEHRSAITELSSAHPGSHPGPLVRHHHQLGGLAPTSAPVLPGSTLSHVLPGSMRAPASALSGPTRTSTWRGAWTAPNATAQVASVSVPLSNVPANGVGEESGSVVGSETPTLTSQPAMIAPITSGAGGCGGGGLQQLLLQEPRPKWGGHPSEWPLFCVEYENWFAFSGLSAEQRGRVLVTTLPKSEAALLMRTAKSHNFLYESMVTEISERVGPPDIFRLRREWREWRCPANPDLCAYQAWVVSWDLRRRQMEAGTQESLDVFLRSLPEALRREALKGNPNRGLEEVHQRLARFLSTAAAIRSAGTALQDTGDSWGTNLVRSDSFSRPNPHSYTRQRSDSANGKGHGAWKGRGAGKGHGKGNGKGGKGYGSGERVPYGPCPLCSGPHEKRWCPRVCPVCDRVDTGHRAAACPDRASEKKGGGSVAAPGGGGKARGRSPHPRGR
jgi:hypothetical protein